MLEDGRPKGRARVRIVPCQKHAAVGLQGQTVSQNVDNAGASLECFVKVCCSLFCAEYLISNLLSNSRVRHYVVRCNNEDVSLETTSTFTAPDPHHACARRQPSVLRLAVNYESGAVSFTASDT